MSLAAIPNNLYVTQGNGQVALQWDLEAGATSYSINRSTDGITFVVLATPTVNTYLDTSVVLGTAYYYQVASVNISGTSPYTVPQAIVPTPTGEMCLSQIRLASQQRADRVNSNFVTTPEWNSYINQSMFELYDLLTTSYEDYFVAPAISFVADGSTFLYPLPNGSNTFTNAAGATIVAAPFYKLLGVDLALNTANNAFVTINKFNFIDRNRFVYPNSASTIYGVFNLRYRLMGNSIEFIPTPSGGQKIRLWYIPRLQQLLQDTDITTIGISGWLEYVIVRAAIYALAKEESDVSGLEKQLIFLKDRIEGSAINRDAGQPDTISDVRQNGFGNGGTGGWNGNTGGFLLSFPAFASNYVSNHNLTHSVFFSQPSLRYVALSISLAYFIYLNKSKLSSRITFSSIREVFSSSTTSFVNHVSNIIGLSTKKQMIRINTSRHIAMVTNTQSFRNRSNKDFICYSVGHNSTQLILYPASTMIADYSFPKPASVSFIDSSHKFSYYTHAINMLIRKMFGVK